jgi:hypothetical protein
MPSRNEVKEQEAKVIVEQALASLPERLKDGTHVNAVVRNGRIDRIEVRVVGLRRPAPGEGLVATP